MKPAAAIILALTMTVLGLWIGACDHLKEMAGKGHDLQTPGAGWEYPYHLIVGGSLSETLSVLSIFGEGDFKYYGDVVPTGQAINDTVLHDGEIYAVCSLSNSIVVYDAGDLSLKREIGVGAGANPMTVAFDADGLAWTPDLIANDVRGIDLSDGTPDDERVKAVVAMPGPDELPRDGDRKGYARPNDVLVLGDRLLVLCGNMNDLYVSGGVGVLVEIDIPTRTRLRTIELAGRNPIDIESLDNRVVISDAGTYDLDTGGFVGDGKIETLDAQTLESAGAIDLPGAPFRMAHAPWGPWFFENGKEGVVLSADLDAMEALPSIALPSSSGPGVSFASALAADGHGFLYAAEFNHDKLYVMDSADNYNVVASFGVSSGPETLLFIHGGEE